MNLFRTKVFSNLTKAVRYCKKNGPKEAFYASLEAFSKNRKQSYKLEIISEEEQQKQRNHKFLYPKTFSILIPAYETKPEHLKALLDSLRDQTYGSFQAIIADAGNTNQVEQVVKHYLECLPEDLKEKFIYKKLDANLGISGNTNQALQYATGDYIGLLDHDDMLSVNALFEMQSAIEDKMKQNIETLLLYSDEDKCNEDGTSFYDPHVKDKFNLDLFLSNNYVCHFTVMKAEILKELQLRTDFDGAQDYDLILRFSNRLFQEELANLQIDPESMRLSEPVQDIFNNKITHVSKILYHWRCHSNSTAENPASKMYAYEAGKRAIEDFLKQRNVVAKVVYMKHLGFYKIYYYGELFSQRTEIGLLGGRIIKNNRIYAGAMDEKGNVLYAGLHKRFSGDMHKAVLYQNVEAVDINCMVIREELMPLYQKYFGRELCFFQEEDGLKPVCTKQEIHQELLSKSIAFCKEVRSLGYLILWDPDWEMEL